MAGGDAFPHASQPQPGAGPGVGSRALVGDRNAECTVAVADGHGRGGGVGVPGDVGERLLDDPVDGQLGT